jgi:zinc protease
LEFKVLVSKSLSRCLLLAGAAVSIALSPAIAAQPAAINGWGVPSTDIPADPSVILGTLPNGMKYAIRRNETPKGTASVRLHFDFGSLGGSSSDPTRMRRPASTPRSICSTCPRPTGSGWTPHFS